ncbi:MAG: CoA pyrophosphatase [Alcanivoracaceae bacterium]
MDTLDLIRHKLQGYQLRDFPVRLPEAAVLMPFTNRPSPELILTVRSAGMPTHAGEVAFPGGKRDPTDQDLLCTALRESQEEVGLSPAEVEVLGQLSPLASRFGMKVTPFVGIVPHDVPLLAEEREIDQIFRVPLEFFLDTRPDMSSPIDFYGKQFRIPTYHYDDKRIWGLTAFMILDLLNNVFDADIPFEESA